MNDNNISIDLTTLIPPTNNSPANQQTVINRAGIKKRKPHKTNDKTIALNKFSEVTELEL